jgi:hypothetical protein
MCYMSFENSDILTQHFANVHDNPSSDNDSSSPTHNDKIKNTATNAINPVVESVIGFI